MQQSAGGGVLRTTSATYTVSGKVATATDANGYTTRYSYDLFDRLTATTDAMGRTTQFTYTLLGQPFRTYNPAISTTTPLLQQTWTADGQRASLTDANGNVTGYAYDGFDRLATTTWPDSSTETLTYDADSNVLTRQARAGGTIAYAYDTLNRLVTKTPPAPWPTVSYTYDLAGRVTSASDTSAAIQSIATPASTTAYTTSTSYDALNRPVGVVWDPAPAATAPATAGPVVTFAHSYNRANQRTGQSVSDSAWIDYPAATPATTAYTANSLNQYTAVGAVTPTWDGNGNLTFDGTSTLGHDPENRLVSATGGGNTAAYAFDPRGRRKVRTVNGTTTITVTGADNRELLDYDGATGAILRWYAYGPGPNAVLNQMNMGSGTRDTMLPDLLGSIVASVDSTTGTIAPFGYRPYGTAAAAPAQFGYTGQRLDQETGLYYYRARHYSPAWGRFTQADPIGYRGGVNLYGYVGNDPLNLADPDGLWQVTISGGYYLGGSITFGRNSGQWNVGVWAGAASGFSARLNIFDLGGAPAGYDMSARGQVNWNLAGPGGSFGLQHSFTTGANTVAGSISLGGGLNISNSFNFDNPLPTMNVLPTFGAGTSAFLGVGGTWTSPATQSAQSALAPTLPPSGQPTLAPALSPNLLPALVPGVSPGPMSLGSYGYSPNFGNPMGQGGFK